MSPKLKPLILPQLVQLREPSVERDPETWRASNSSSSDITTPVTPTFSRGHLRGTSSSSSMELTALPGPESPTASTFVSKTGKRALPDVMEEPHEKDIKRAEQPGHNECFCDQHCLYLEDDLIHSSLQLSRTTDLEYDLTDGFFSDGDLIVNEQFRKRGHESTFSSIASRIGGRFPSFSRSRRARKNTISSQQSVTSFVSSRSSSVSNSRQDVGMPPTPTRSVFDEEEEGFVAPIDIDKANRPPRDELASTPLLPPLMDEVLDKETPIPSPLQSPTVADTTSFIRKDGSMDLIITTRVASIPSPPLSSKPSIQSFHRNTRLPQLTAAPDVPPIVIPDVDDEWANKLGHSNFTIYPEPYLPDVFDVEACRTLRANWELARCNYAKHIVRIGEHYGSTSKIYKLTEEKWASIEAEWRRHNELTIQSTVENSENAFASLKHSNISDIYYSNVMTKIPMFNDGRSGGKFPQLGDEDIVGPMVKVAVQLPPPETKKAKLMKFFAAKLPVGFGRA